TDLLGTYHLDRGRYLVAALCFERLLGPELAGGAAERDPAVLSPRRRAGTAPLTLFKAAFAFRRAGDHGRAEQVLKLLGAPAARDGLRLADQPVSLNQARRELDRGTATEAAQTYAWEMFRGGPDRNALARGSAPYLQERLWQRSLIPENVETRNMVEV